MEVSVDNIVVKSEKVDEYTKDFKEFFGVLSKFGVKLNPEK